MAKKATKGTTATAKAGFPVGSIDPIPPELTDVIQNHRCALFVGAGLSIGAGLPGWVDLLDKLVVACESRRLVSSSHAAELKTLIASNESNKLLMAAQELSDHFGKGAFVDAIAAELTAPVVHLSAAHVELTGIPFNLVLTTNYDKLIESSYAKPGYIPRIYTHNNAADFADALWRNEFFILKAHGDVDHRNEIVITERDYRDIIFRSHGYRAALSAIFTTRSVLFVGTSLNDPETRLLLGFLHDAFHGCGAKHYALVPYHSFTETEASRWYKDFQVTCIRYNPSSPAHPEVVTFLQNLPHVP